MRRLRNREPSAVAVGAANTLWFEKDCARLAPTPTPTASWPISNSRAPDWRKVPAPSSCLAPVDRRAPSSTAFSKMAEKIFASSIVRSNGAQDIGKTLRRRVTAWPWAESARARPGSRRYRQHDDTRNEWSGSPEIDFSRARKGCRCRRSRLRAARNRISEVGSQATVSSPSTASACFCIRPCRALKNGSASGRK